MNIARWMFFESPKVERIKLRTVPHGGWFYLNFTPDYRVYLNSQFPLELPGNFQGAKYLHRITENCDSCEIWTIREPTVLCVRNPRQYSRVEHPREHDEIVTSVMAGTDVWKREKQKKKRGGITKRNDSRACVIRPRANKLRPRTSPPSRLHRNWLARMNLYHGAAAG